MKHKFLFLFFLYFSITVHAQNVRLIVPYTAGGVTDRSARVIEKTLTRRLPYSFTIEYQTGAGGIIAANTVAKNSTKETVLLIHSSSIVTNLLDPNSAYDLLNDFVPVAMVGSVPMVLVTNRQTGIVNLKQLKHTDLPLFYATAGPGTALHVAGQRLQQSLNINITPVPYRGESAAFNDILSNNVTMMFASLSMLTGYTNSTQISMIAITGNQRNADLPKIPTFSEQGVQGLDRSPNWLVLLANQGADSTVVSRIRSALEESFKDPQDQALYLRAGVEINRKPTTNVQEFLTEEIKKVKPLKSKL
jgi:tripartite-type tricarboxylate transporter receptor subunit TctC